MRTLLSCTSIARRVARLLAMLAVLAMAEGVSAEQVVIVRETRTVPEVVLGGIVAYLFGALAYGFSGWEAPVLTGFRVGGDVFDPSSVRAVPLWQDTILVYGLAWFATLCVGATALLTSVLLRSTTASMGTMLAALIAGTILPRLASQWEAQKYLFVTNLPLPDYYSGSPPPIFRTSS